VYLQINFSDLPVVFEHLGKRVTELRDHLGENESPQFVQNLHHLTDKFTQLTNEAKVLKIAIK